MPVTDPSRDAPGDVGSGDDDGMSGGAVLALLAGAVGTSAATLTDLLSDPAGFILGTVLEAIVGGVLTVVEVVIGAVQAAFAPLRNLPGVLGDSISGAFTGVADAILWLPLTLEDVFVDLAESLGPWAPFVLVPSAIALAVGLYIGGTWALNLLSPRIATLIGE